MAADLSAYEQRANQAEGLVAMLKKEVEELRAHVEAEQLQKVVAENDRLRQQVQAAKRKLREAELSNNKRGLSRIVTHCQT